MLPQLSLAFQITIVGMGLVFASIFLLWGLMALLVRITQKTEEPSIEEVEDVQDLKRLAAVAAVSVALAGEQVTEPHSFPLPPTASVSPWQAVMRTKMLNKRGSVR